MARTSKVGRLDEVIIVRGKLDDKEMARTGYQTFGGVDVLTPVERKKSFVPSRSLRANALVLLVAAGVAGVIASEELGSVASEPGQDAVSDVQPLQENL